MPIEPVDPSKKVGDGGSEKYTPPREKFGPSEYDKVAEKVKQDNEKADRQIRKLGDALDKAGVPLPKKESFPKTTAAFVEICRYDAERAARKAEKAKAEVHDIAEKHRAKTEAERPRTYAERLQDMGRLPKPSGGGGGASGIPKTGKKPYDFKKGGKVSSASKRADGCCIRGKTKI
jgi:ABC-type Fe3+-hydroxamate transport system substrate-binding protein